MLKKIVSIITITFLFAAVASSQIKKKKKAKAKPAVIEQVTQNLLQGSVAVQTESHWRIPFWVGSRGGKVTGRITVQGGAKNDVFVLILDEDGYTNWKNGNISPTYFNSGRTSVTNIETWLAEGQYYLVFNNDAWLSAKTVYGNVYLIEPTIRKL